MNSEERTFEEGGADIVEVLKQALQKYSLDVFGFIDAFQALEHF